MIKYKGYQIYPDMTGVADFQYYFTLYQDERVIGFGDSVEQCEFQIENIVKLKIIDILDEFIKDENLEVFKTVDKIFDLI